jgi:8-oxo-dGTP pyrophosphatase MutT (NUDIX family)
VYGSIRALWWIWRPVILGVRVLVVRRDRVLLVNHAYRERWFLPGGRPERDEPLLQTARREAREETDVSVGPLELLGLYTSLSGRATDHVVVFVERRPPPSAPVPGTGEGKPPGSSEISQVRWVSVGEPPVELAPQTDSILRDWRRGRRAMYRVLEQ